MTQQLSPAAKAVLDAVLATYADNIPKNDSLWALERASTVAALRAAADQVVPEERRPSRRGVRPGGTGALTPEEGAEDQRAATRRLFLSIATELEAQ